MSADPDRIAAARLLLDQLGVTLDDLRRATPTDQAARMPTLASYLPRVMAAAGPGANRTYGSYWQRMLAAWGNHRLDQITASDIEALQHRMAATARSRRNSRHGRHAGEHVIAAARAIYTRAIGDNLIIPGASPAHRIAKPRRLPSTRRALTAHELEQINTAARTSGNDVILDALLLRLHTETACRRGGALALRLGDLNTDHCLVQLREKGSTVRWQPISPALAASLAEHCACRGAILPADPLLRYRDGRPLSSRRYDHLWRRLGQQLPWVAGQGISTHWLRHTTLTWVERHYGYGIARAYAGHTDSVGPATTTYIKADLQPVATALAAMTGQPHPSPTQDRQHGPVTTSTAGKASPCRGLPQPPRFSDRYTDAVVSGGWQVYVVNEVRDWIDSLDAAAHARIVQAIDTLADVGPGLGRPLVDTIHGSSIANLKELRPGTVRILFAFDPWRDSILLVAGDKAGRWTQWYREAIPLAEQRYERYLKERAQEEEEEQL